ncbi:Gaa1-domain-containing protein [Guyanagaster necrorhizus]|uniref:Gaa1-domain-containing protein n=1 Tax=Guyanagaster necrorhizus TaxID=856835 RepID=A0A9P7VXD9_9AGAR|nr:Gaa1-domain-containing protein [Guyanagaster necrorhizus MCA 3950]KAG7447959.1 Gaa1-domain-containing protein [Guyanagaster necrorhizus MCA 3950]
MSSDSPFWLRKLTAINSRLFPRGDANLTRLKRRQALFAAIGRRLPLLRTLLFVAGYLWILAIPTLPGQGTYIDENALLPGQVNTNWNWAEVHAADRYLDHIEKLRDDNATSEQRAKYFAEEFKKLGIPASTQNYTFSTVFGDSSGTNAYATMSAPRSPGVEAMVISASWLSRTGEGAGSLNLRGVSTVLALAGFLRRYSFWAKDLVFVISDDYLEGMQAWLSAYHGISQSNLHTNDLDLSSGVIWTALSIDYPGHSFSHLGMFHEGLNGRLPNQDLLNSFIHISKYSGGVPVILYDYVDHQEYPDQYDLLPSWIPASVRQHPDVKGYLYRFKNVLRHGRYQARGIGSGVHALFHQFRIDAFTIFALPATGPHGFHAIGRIIESTLRTTNNLLERLHASFFFYILTDPDNFLKIGLYLPSAILISVAMMLTGLSLWVEAGWTTSGDKKSTDKKWTRRKRPILHVLAIMISTHLLGVTMFYLVNNKLFFRSRICPVAVMLITAVPPIYAIFIPAASPSDAPLSVVLKALNLCFASTVISITTVLNFSLAASMAILLGIPLSVSPTSSRRARPKTVYYIAYALFGLGWLVLCPEGVRKAVLDWETLGVWFGPFLCIVIAPLVLQAGVVCILV